MYPIHTQQNVLSTEMLDFVAGMNFGSDHSAVDSTERLRKIADLSFDILSSVQKTEKLRKLGQLSKSGESEYDSNVRLVGLMVNILKQYGYHDAEMMESLNKKYEKIALGLPGQTA